MWSRDETSTRSWYSTMRILLTLLLTQLTIRHSLAIVHWVGQLQLPWAKRRVSKNKSCTVLLDNRFYCYLCNFQYDQPSLQSEEHIANVNTCNILSTSTRTQLAKAHPTMPCILPVLPLTSQVAEGKIYLHLTLLQSIALMCWYQC